MDAYNIQRLLTAAGYYNGALDGDMGKPSVEIAIHKIIENHPSDPTNPKWRIEWKLQRKAIAAIQLVLKYGGYEPGVIDGLYGHNTREAFNGYMYYQAHGSREIIEREEKHPEKVSETAKVKWPTQNTVPQFFGPAGGPLATAGKVKLALPMRIAWDKDDRIETFTCHQLVAKPFEAIFAETVKHYGEKDWRALGLDLFGGCYNNRNMRGGTRKSMHAFGIAIDIDPERNQLRWDRKRATLDNAEYEPFWKIVEKHGGVSLGRVSDFDWMHFQFARLK